LSFTRRHGDEAIHSAFNIGRARHAHKAPAGDVLLTLNGADPQHLPAWGVLFVKLRAQ
jgi:hypothetical protein